MYGISLLFSHSDHWYLLLSRSHEWLCKNIVMVYLHEFQIIKIYSKPCNIVPN